MVLYQQEKGLGWEELEELWESILNYFENGEWNWYKFNWGIYHVEQTERKKLIKFANKMDDFAYYLDWKGRLWGSIDDQFYQWFLELIRTMITKIKKTDIYWTIEVKGKCPYCNNVVWFLHNSAAKDRLKELYFSKENYDAYCSECQKPFTIKSKTIKMKPRS